MTDNDVAVGDILTIEPRVFRAQGPFQLLVVERITKTVVVCRDITEADEDGETVRLTSKLEVRGSRVAWHGPDRAYKATETVAEIRALNASVLATTRAAQKREAEVRAANFSKVRTWLEPYYDARICLSESEQVYALTASIAGREVVLVWTLDTGYLFEPDPDRPRVRATWTGDHGWTTKMDANSADDEMGQLCEIALHFENIDSVLEEADMSKRYDPKTDEPKPAPDDGCGDGGVVVP